MRVESLLKVLEKGSSVTLKDKSEKELICFRQENDIKAISCTYLFRNIEILKAHGNTFTAILGDTKNE